MTHSDIGAAKKLGSDTALTRDFEKLNNNFVTWLCWLLIDI